MGPKALICEPAQTYNSRCMSFLRALNQNKHKQRKENSKRPRMLLPFEHSNKTKFKLWIIAAYKTEQIVCTAKM